MSTRPRLGILAGWGVLALACIATAVLSTREPTYNGLTMEQWLHQPDHAQRDEALQILVTNNLSLLVKRVTNDPRDGWLPRIANKLPPQWPDKLGLDRLASRRFDRYSDAVRILERVGTNAAPVIPQLQRIVKRGGHRGDAALGALSFLGDEGLAILASKATHTNVHMRFYALGLLDEHQDSIVARLALTNALDDPDSRVRNIAWFYITNR